MDRRSIDLFSSENNYAVGLNSFDLDKILKKVAKESLRPDTCLYGFNHTTKQFERISYEYAVSMIRAYEMKHTRYSENSEYSIKSKDFYSEDGEKLTRFTLILHDEKSIYCEADKVNFALQLRLDFVEKYFDYIFFDSFLNAKSFFYKTYKKYADCTRKELEMTFASLLRLAN
jgi:hypothetical protein